MAAVSASRLSTQLNSDLSNIGDSFRSIYGCNAKELRDLSIKAKDLNSTKTLTIKQSATQDLMHDRIRDADHICQRIAQNRMEEISTVEKKSNEVRELRQERQNDADRLRERLSHLQNEINRRRTTAKQRDVSSTTPKVTHPSTSISQRCRNFLHARSILNADLRYYTWLLRNVAELTDEELCAVDGPDLAPIVEDWSTTVQRVEKQIKDITLEASALNSMSDRTTQNISFGCDLQKWATDIQEQWVSLRRVHSHEQVRLQTQMSQRNENKKNKQSFMMEQTKMLQWCREQTVQLEHLQDTNHVQEFCASLQNNNATMEANFLILSDMAESLLPDDSVQKALTDVSHEWFQLQVYTYQRLRQCLMEQHSQAKLEDTLRDWTNYFYPVKEYLVTVEGLLLQPTEEEAISFIAPLLETVRTLQNEAVPHQLIVDHLADFSLRMQCIQENYDALRPSIFSSLSLLYTSLYVKMMAQNTLWAQRGEYNQRIGDISNWIDVHGQAEVWDSILKRLSRAKETLQQVTPAAV